MLPAMVTLSSGYTTLEEGLPVTLDWRLALALPFLWLLAILLKQRPQWPGRAMVAAMLRT